MPRKEYAGYYLSIENKNYYFFPGKIAFAWQEYPWYFEASTNPDFLEDSVKTAFNERMKKTKDPPMKEFSVPLKLLDDIESAATKKDFTLLIKHLRELEKYRR